MSFITFVDTTLLFFNFIALNVGTYFILNNYEDLNTKKGIQDCYNLFLLTGLSVINNLIPYPRARFSKFSEAIKLLRLC